MRERGAVEVALERRGRGLPDGGAVAVAETRDIGPCRPAPEKPERQPEQEPKPPLQSL